jgi:hypothetical protein
MTAVAILVIVLMCAGLLFMSFVFTCKDTDGGKMMLAHAILAVLCFTFANVIGVLSVIYKLGGM